MMTAARARSLARSADTCAVIARQLCVQRMTIEVDRFFLRSWEHRTVSPIRLDIASPLHCRLSARFAFIKPARAE